MLYFECPACKANCETTEAFAGKTVHCPHCGKSVAVPTDPAAVTTTPPTPKPKPAPTATQAASPQASTSSIARDPSGNQLRNVILVLVGIAALVGLGIWLIPADSSNSSKGSAGTIKIELFQEKAPISTANFLKYVDQKHYDGTIFHRVMKDFMIQGGGFEPGMRQKDSKFAPIKNEAHNGLSNKRGTVAMARTPDPNSATDQFFINVVDNASQLDPGRNDPNGYAVFGKVIDGMDVVDKIRMVAVRDRNGHQAVPIKDVTIRSIRRAESATGGNPVVMLETAID